MSRPAVRLSIAIALLCVATARTQVAQTPAAGASPFAGRWEVTLHPPAGEASPMSDIPFCILEIKGGGATAAGTLVDYVGAPMLDGKLVSLTVKDEQITVALDMTGKRITLTGKRAGDRLEGKAAAEGETEEATWTGKTTTHDKIDLAAMMQSLTAAMQAPGATPPSGAGSPAAAKPADVPADTKAYREASTTFGPDRVKAFQQFLKDFPDSKMKETATLQLAQSYPSATERVAALNKFLEDFPNSASKDQANLQIALAPVNPADKAAALHKFIADFPTSRLKEQAEYQLTTTFMNAAERQAAQEQFIKDHPKSTYTTQIYQTWFDTQVREKPVNEARLSATIDGLLGAAPDMSMPSSPGHTISLRAQTMNTVADRLMSNDVMLNKALDVIQQALTSAGDKEEPSSLGIYTTTLGQVQFKLQKYDEAGETLKKAIQLSGGDGDAEAQLFLGKYYDVKHNDDAAYEAYLKASELGAPYDTKALLEKAYIRKYGSIAGFDEKMDAIYRAKPKAFDAGHYARPASKDPAKVVLSELFTGAECHPCVASDLAFDGLGERYGHDDVAVLVYHLHIPGPDPMTNADTEARAKYYKVNATPTVVVDGAALPANGGGIPEAGPRFKEYTAKIEPRLETKPLAALSDFKAKIAGKAIKVTGQASLVSDAGSTGTTATLHVALVEDVVRYMGGNGTRFHNFVVRKLLGSAEGTALAKPGTKTAFSEVVDMAAVSAGLDSYLDSYEKGGARASSGFKFKERVDQLDPAKMRIVAFVQNDQTKEILQAVFVTPGK